MDENVSNNLIFYSGSLRNQSIPNHSLSLNPIEILAVDPIAGTNIENFEQPLQISLGYSEGDFTEDEERNLQVFYYSDLYQDWFPIETTTDPDLNRVHFQTDHLTVFDIKAADWQSYIPPITQSYEVSAFTGALNYSYPLQTFAGPGGLKPDLTLSYNSQIIDQSIAYTQASWVGMGWSLETGYITRDMHGTEDTTNDDSFYLSYNGISQRLLPISQANGVIHYRSQENPTEKVTWNTSSNIWEVRSGDGLIYTFGGINAVAKLKQGSGCAEAVDDLNLTWEWGLTSVVDRFGNTVTYEYILEVKGVSDTDTDEDKYCYNHINLTPSRILYGSFEIKFVTTPRYDFRSSWQHFQSKVLFTRSRLDHVDIMVNGSIVKSYLLRYAANTETSNVIYPNFIWFRNFKTSTLISVQEVQTSGANPVEGYKPITFSYFDGEDTSSEDYMHLLEVNNGYGGKLQFSYVPMYQADDVNKDVRSARWCFGSQDCPGNNPLLTTYCVSSNPNRGWSGHRTVVMCDPSVSEGNLKIVSNGSIDTIAFRPFPEVMIKPGGRYIFYGKAQSTGQGTNTEFGFTSGVPADELTDPISVPVGFMNKSASPWVYGEDYLVMPAGYNFDDVQLYLRNQGLLVKDLQVQQFITRYVVTRRIETDTITEKSASWTYTYPAEGFKMNTGIGANPYIKTKLEYRGFSSVTITQQESTRQDSLIQVLSFHQDELLKGKLSSQLTKGSNGLCYFRNLFTYETATLLPYSQLVGLNTFTDLNISWIKLIGIEKQSFDGANCSSLSTSDHLGTQEVYSHPSQQDYWTSLNGSPLSIKQRVFNGVSWVDEFATIYEYEPSIDLVLGGKTFFFSQILKATRIKACASGSCTGALLAETLYFYNSNKSLSSQKVWTRGAESARQYTHTNFTYHLSGGVASKTEWQGFSTATGNPTGASKTTQFAYDAVFPTQVTQEVVSASGNTYATSTVYDPRFGLPIQVTHPNGAIESAVYDGLGRTKRICAPGDAADYNTCFSGTIFTLNITYNLTASPPQITIQRRSMASILLKYTGFGKLNSRTILSAKINGVTANWEENAYDYDGLGRVIVERTGGLPTSTSYDMIGRILNTSRLAGTAVQPVATYGYTIEALDAGQKVWKTSIADANGNTSFSYTNAKGQVVKTSPPTGSGPSVQFTYDLLGRLTRSMYGIDTTKTTTITYNPAGQKIQMVDPDMGTWTYTYDAQGNLLTQTTRREPLPAAAITTTLAYDALNRLASKSFSNGFPSIGYTYDANSDVGYRTSMTDGTGSTTWDYDLRGRLITEAKTISEQTFTTNYSYNSADQLTSMTYPSGQIVNTSHLPQGGVNTVGTYLIGTQVNPNGMISLRTFGNGTTTNLTYNDWLANDARLSMLQSGQNASLLKLSFTYDGVGNIKSITDHLNSNQVQTFSYDAMNRLISARTNAVGQGQYNQTYAYDATTGNMSSKSDVGAYTYSATQPHAVTQAGSNAYGYDLNGNMTGRTAGGVVWSYTYNAEGKIVQVKKNGSLISEYGYDGDGNRVLAKDYEGYLATNPKVTTYVGNYYEVHVEGYLQQAGGPPGQPCNAPSYCAYLPLVAKSVVENISYYYADGQRIAMKNNGVVSYLYGDQLGSVSAVAKADGSLLSKSWYHPWGTTRYSQNTSPTDYAYTGQIQEGDIYFYNARWYDPQLGRFMQADIIVPPTQGIQGFDRFAYVNNSPITYSDPSGGSVYDPNSIAPENEIVLIVSGSLGNIDETAIFRAGPKPLEQMTAWDWNPWKLPMDYVQYPGSKYGQYEDIKKVVTTNVHTAVCYSAAPEACLMFVVDRQKKGMEVKNLILIGPAFTGSDTSDVNKDIGFNGWKEYLDKTLKGGTNVLIVDNLLPLSSENERLLFEYKAPEGATGSYSYQASFFKHYDSGGKIRIGSNNSRLASFLYYSWSILVSWE